MPGDDLLGGALGRLLARRGRHAEAEAVLARAVRHNPASALLQIALGNALQAQGRESEAAARFQDAIRCGDRHEPDALSALFINLGAVMLRLGDGGSALGALRRALALAPADRRALNNLGMALNQSGRPVEASAAFRRVLSLNPADGKALDNLGGLHQDRRNHEAAVRLRRLSIVAAPGSADPYANLGGLLLDLDRLAEAERACRRALRLEPGIAAVRDGLGAVLQALGRWAGAEAEHRAALALDPAEPAAHAHLGILLSRWGSGSAAEASLSRALRLDPEHAPARLHLAFVLLDRGLGPEGWKNYAWRFRAKGYANRAIEAPSWDGEPLEGRRLLVWREQGVGDEILFASCFPDLAGRAGGLVIECDPRLVTLFARSFPRASVRPQSVAPDGSETIRPPDCEFHAPAGGAPRFLRSGLRAFPSRPSWLVPDPARVVLWRDRLEALGPGLKVGIGWRSQLMTMQRRAAYTNLEDWAPLFRVPGLVFVNLQYGDCAEEIERAEARFGVRLHRWAELDLKDDFEAAAALVSNLDLVISPAMSAGELAGALGVPVWRFGGRDWTQLGTGVRPWFPSMRLWQPRPGEALPDVLARMARELAAGLAASRTAPASQVKAAGTAGAGTPTDPTAGLPPALLSRDSGRLLAAALEGYRAGDLDDAARLCALIPDGAPEGGAALHLLGRVELRRGRPDLAAGLLARAAERDPGNASVHAGRATALRAVGRVEEACASLRNAAAAQPESAVHWLNRAALLGALGRVAEGFDDCRRAIRLQPDLALAHTHLGGLHAQRGDAAEAARRLRRALALAPDAADATTNLGNALHALDRMPEAVWLWRRAARLAPDGTPGLAASLTNLGNGEAALGRTGAAEAAHRRALALAPDMAEAHANLAHVMRRLNRPEAAESGYRRALSANPAFAIAHYNLGLLRLERGELRPGWNGVERRFATPEFQGQERRLAARVWRGENVARARILVWREQGVGDELMFASCYGDLMARAGHVVIECDRRLTSLFARSFPGATVRPPTADPRDVDVCVAAGSLPRLLRPDAKRFPSRPSWLVPDPARVALWRERLEALGPGLKVGIGWRSQLMTTQRRAAYTNLEDWAPLFRVPGLVFVNLQYGDCAEEIERAEARFGVRLHRWSDLDLKDDFEAAAALASNLDLVISPAMSAGELAGALGVPVWRFGGRDWTQLGTGVRPWFPSMRLWQPRPGEALPDVLARMARELAAGAAGSPPTEGGTGHAARDAAAEDVETLLEEAVGHHRAGRSDNAAALYAAALARDPDHPVALHLSGLLAHEAGDQVLAAARIGRAVAHRPDYAAAQASLGTVLLAQNRPEEAALRFRAVLALRPGDAPAMTNLGNALDASHHDERSILAHRRAADADPFLAAAHDNLGAVLCRLDRAEEAEARHRRALALDAGLVAAWINHAIASRRLGRQPGARSSLARALALDPASGDAMANLGRLLRDGGMAVAAERWCNRALAVAPGEPTAAFNKALLQLGRGDLGAGWDGYDRRFLTRALAGAARATGLPAWTGEDLADRSILVWGEQGIGDELMFASCYGDLIQQAGSSVIECDRRLVPLFARSFPRASVRAAAGPLAPVPPGPGLQAAAGSLPRWLRPSLARFPTRPAFLVPDAGRAATWRERVAALGPGLKVGIAWRSGLMTADRLANYAPLDRWGPVFAVLGVTFINLQYGDCHAELDAARRDMGVVLRDWSDLDLKDDLDGVAALISCLDLVLSPASSVGELAGALGVPVWRFGAAGDWTRLGTGARPWFHSMRLFLTGPGQAVPDLLPVMARELRRLAGP
nr:tetratricopeptide repeat protein [Azospirillum sp. SYSU D00513]